MARQRAAARSVWVTRCGAGAERGCGRGGAPAPPTRQAASGVAIHSLILLPQHPSQLIATSGRAYTAESQYQGATVRSGANSYACRSQAAQKNEEGRGRAPGL